MKIATCIMCSFLYLTTSSVKAQYESCNTPEYKPGECQNIVKCPKLLALLKKRPLSQQSSNYLKKSNCGFEGFDPMVCCPLEIKEKKPKLPNPPRPRPDLLPNTEECGYVSDSRIVGGKEADLYDFPWMALIEYDTPEGRGFYCGGVLISKRYVLTAAHCINGKEIQKDRKIVSVRLGEHNLETDQDCETQLGEKVCNDLPVDVPVVEHITHKSFDPFDRNLPNDIALLRLGRDVQFTDFVKPICVPISQEIQKQDFANTNVTVAGWGQTETRKDSSVKLKLMIPVRSPEECENIYSSGGFQISDGQLCAGGSAGKDTCGGDSGGPLMTLIGENGIGNWYVGGIVSFGRTSCGTEGWPGIYTRVTKYVPWILNHLKP